MSTGAHRDEVRMVRIVELVLDSLGCPMLGPFQQAADDHAADYLRDLLVHI